MTGNPTALPSLVVRYEQTIPVLELPSEPPFEQLREWLREQVPAVVAQLNGRAIRLDYGPREIKLFDLRRTVHFLKEEFGIEVTGLYLLAATIHRFAERELKLKLFPLTEDETPTVDATPEGLEVDAPVAAAPAEPEPAPEAKLAIPTDLTAADLEGTPGAELIGAPPVEPAAPSATEAPAARRVPNSDPGQRSLGIYRTLRSGVVVRFDGDVIVYGDVNPGANVVATGNITVLGALKGTAHAGASGDEDKFILAFLMRPTQVRVGRKIAILPDTREEKASVPEIATVVDAAIAIEPYRGRLRA